MPSQDQARCLSASVSNPRSETSATTAWHEQSPWIS